MRPARNGCRDRRAAVLRYVDGELAVEDCLSLELHLETCEPCRRAIEFHQQVEELLHVGAGVEADEGYEDRIVRGVHARLTATEAPTSPPVRAVTRRRRAPWIIALASAAAVVIVPMLDWTDSDRRFEPVTPIPDRAVAEAPSVPDADIQRDGPPSRTYSEQSYSEQNYSEEDRVEPERLAMAKLQLREALLVADRAGEGKFRAVFESATAPLADADWPVDELLRSALSDPDPQLANAAIRGTAELGLRDTLPALERACRRGDTAASALRALGTLGDRLALDQLQRGLNDPSLAPAAIYGLARLGSADAARILAERLDDAELQDQIGDELLIMGAPGVAELIRRDQRGDRLARSLLMRGDAPTAEHLRALLDGSAADDEITLAALRFAPAFGDALLPEITARVGSEGELGEAAFTALEQIGGTEAMRIALAIEPSLAFPVERIDHAIRSMLRRSLDPTAPVLELARGESATRLIEALAMPEEFSRLALARVLSARDLEPSVRAAAAERLAEFGALDAAPTLAMALDMMFFDADSAARLLCAAARAGATPRDAHRLQPLPGRTARELLRRAEASAERWRRDGLPPLDHERRRLRKLLSAAVTRI